MHEHSHQLVEDLTPDTAEKIADALRDRLTNNVFIITISCQRDGTEDGYYPKANRRCAVTSVVLQRNGDGRLEFRITHTEGTITINHERNSARPDTQMRVTVMPGQVVFDSYLEQHGRIITLFAPV
jgi:hypothetical protein